MKTQQTDWTRLATATNGEILQWAGKQSWACAMARCGQDARWHAEGDVWTHTQLVCEALERQAFWAESDRATQLKLLWAAMLHDCGKPVTSRLDPETGRIRALNHSVTGAEMARRVLRDMGCDLQTREEIVTLVRYHSRPGHFLEKPNPELEIISLSWLLNTQWLHTLALADTGGRETLDMSDSEAKLMLWRSAAIELGCLGEPYQFANDQERFLFYRGQLNNLHYTPWEDYRCTVTLLAGLPGAGKDTWLAKNYPQSPVVSLDEIRDEMDISPTAEQGQVVQAAKEQCRTYLRAGVDFTFNATNVTRALRQRWVDLFAEYQARIEIVYLEPPMSVLLAQNRRRPQPVPEKIIQRLLEKLDVPSRAESHRLTLASGSES